MNSTDIYKEITIGLLYPAILGALLYNIFEYMNETKEKFRNTHRNSILKCISDTAKQVISIRHFLLVLFFFFYFFNFLRISYIEASYNLFAFLSDIIDITLIYVGFKMLINPEMDPNKNSTCLKKGYVLGFFVVLNNIIWKLILFKFNIKLIIANKEETNILILNIFTIVVMIAGWSWGYKKLWYNKYIMSIFCFLLVGIYITLVCKILHNQYNLFRFI